MVQHQRENYSWEFVFIGANQDAFAKGATLGVAKAANLVADAAGTTEAFDGVARGISAYRKGGSYH